MDLFTPSSSWKPTYETHLRMPATNQDYPDYPPWNEQQVCTWELFCFLHKNLRIFFSPLNLYSKKLPHPWLQIAPPMVFKRLRDGSKGVPFDEFSPTCWASKPTNFRRFSMEISDFSRASSSTRTMLSATFLRAWGDERNSKFRTETTGGKQKDG